MQKPTIITKILYFTYQQIYITNIQHILDKSKIYMIIINLLSIKKYIWSILWPISAQSENLYNQCNYDLFRNNPQISQQI